MLPRYFLQKISSYMHTIYFRYTIDTKTVSPDPNNPKHQMTTLLQQLAKVLQIELLSINIIGHQADHNLHHVYKFLDIFHLKCLNIHRMPFDIHRNNCRLKNKHIKMKIYFDKFHNFTNIKMSLLVHQHFD